MGLQSSQYVFVLIILGEVFDVYNHKNINNAKYGNISKALIQNLVVL